MNREFDVVVCLGGGRNKDGSLTELSQNRLRVAAQTVLSGQSKQVLVMGGRYKGYELAQGLHDEAGEVVRTRFLSEQCRVSPEKIITPTGECRDTIYEGFIARQVAIEKNWDSLLVCTSIHHLKRALYIFERLFPENSLIQGIESPCLDDLNPLQEIEMLDLTTQFFAPFPKSIPAPVSWDIWYADHAQLYLDQRSIQDKYARNGVYSQAHQTINTSKN